MYAIVLAAGLSKRMGKQKLLLPFEGATILETVLKNLHNSGFENICCVFSREVDEKITNRPAWLSVAINPAPERGQSSSLAIGLGMVPDGENFCIMLGDLPLAKAEDIAALYRKFQALPEEKTVLTPARDGAFGHPMFYKAIWKDRFAGAEGDMGGKAILKKYWDEIETTVAESGHFKDIDTPEDYKKSLPSY
ncbi:nucleotidyltransferase family protein [Synergistaceae bacterium OttesenSCG-928-D05]|nr:nucleotidyltransferase family protein [Synergistaceae bacterium OttesenSCG-928-D05]